ncbi:MAG TPA: DEAD/DEAH box helicase [Caulobacteraceae bacterium]|nr:DEAD/DEAH box helicase [Caulobacteraceae bacterium]
MRVSELPPTLAEALAERGYSELTAVQVAVAGPEAMGRDLLVSSKTGSGKTVAYGLAVAETLLGRSGALGPAGAPAALVIAPTRELALQVQRELAWLYARTQARVVSCVGGMDPRREQRALAGGAHIVVGTPGRLRDHLERGQLDLSSLKVVVLDEADEMLDLGFREELEALLEAAPPERRTLLFSATLPRPILALARRYQREAHSIAIGERERGHTDIDYRAIAIAPSDVEHATVNLLRFYAPGSAIVFCSTREAVRRLHANLAERGFSAVALSGELTQNERANALQALRDRRAQVCIATDVAARGLDIPDLELVIHAELPHDAQALQHRSGRTGRAGRKGVSAILVPYPRRRRVEGMLRAAGVSVQWQAAPTPEEIRGKDQERLVEELRPEGEIAEDDLSVARVLLSGEAPEVVVAALIRALRANLPAPEDLAETSPEPPPEPQPVDGERRRPGFEDTVWYRVNIGRSRNAEARWLLPMICRRGHITKLEIGAIRVYDADTRFEIKRAVAERFDAALAASPEDGLRITPLTDPEAPVKGGRGGFGGKAQRDVRGKPRAPDRAEARDRPAGHKPAAAHPRKDKKRGPKPARGKRSEEG